MLRADTDVLEYHLRGLDGESLAALVADLWAARGYETTREGATVRATHGGETLRVVVARAAGGEPPSSAESVDVLVAFGDASGGDARVVDAAGLAELLAYAVDRPVALELCERHLGATPGALPPPPLERLERGIGSRLDGAAPALVAATVLLGLGVVLLAGAGPFAEGDALEGDAAAVTTPADVGTPEGVSRADSEVTVEAVPYPSRPGTPPPGLTSEGVVDLGALASAHAAVVANRSHTVWLDRHSRQLNSNASGVQQDIDMATDGENYRVVTTRVEDDSRQRLGEVYYDGTTQYGAVYNETTGDYDRVFRIDPRHDVAPTPDSIGNAAIWRYLSAEETNVTGRTETDESTVYRVVATGKPNATTFDRVRNYSAVAVIDARGYVRDLTVAFDERRSGRVYRIRHEITYDRIGSTTVDRPAWYERHRENATGE